EASQIAGGASGKAGGLLALWAYPSNIVPLSYNLHAELAQEHGGKERGGDREVNCGQLIADGRRRGRCEKYAATTEGAGDETCVRVQRVCAPLSPWSPGRRVRTQRHDPSRRLLRSAPPRSPPELTILFMPGATARQ